MPHTKSVSVLDRAILKAMESGEPLAARLKMAADSVHSTSPEFAEAVDTFVERLIRAEAGGAAPKLGDVLPDFLMPDQHGRLVSLAALRAEGPVIVAFLRGHWCPYCRITAGALAEIAEQTRQHGASIVAVSPESREFTQHIDRDTHGAFPIVSDYENGYALSNSLAIWVDENVSALIEASGSKVTDYQGNDACLLPIPAIFLVARDGRIAYRHVNPDYRERANLVEMLAALASLD